MKVELYTTNGKKADMEYVMRKETLFFNDDTEGVENEVINIYPEITYEIFEGIGGAITDSAAYVYSLMEEEQKREVMKTYFSSEQMKYGLVRIHMDSCDFSMEQYEAVSDPEDIDLTGFSFERTEKYIIPMLEDAQKAAGGKLKLMLSPWSPPAFMKTNNARVKGGSLKPQYREFWAKYLCRYIQEFQKRGYMVQRISLQNEPKAVQTWDSCIYTAEEEKEFLRDFMYPALKKHGFDDIEIFIGDHNKERSYERTCAIVDEKTAHMVQGVACHWYSGDHFENLELLRKQYPDLKLIISESCIEYSKFSAADEIVNAGRLSHELIGDLNHGITAFYDWNLLLDEKGGPNYVKNYCQAPFLYDTKRKKLMPQLLLKHFYHISHFIETGAVRIGFSRYTAELDVTSYKNPDGSIVFVMLNRESKDLPAVVRMNGKVVKFMVQAGTVCTGVITEETNTEVNSYA